MTGNDDDELAREAVHLGAEDYLIKGDGTPASIMRSLSYAIERNHIANELRYLAHHDALTGTPNPEEFIREVERVITRTEHTWSMAAVLALNLDHFHSINETLGHAEATSSCASSRTGLGWRCARVDTLARMAGDELAIVLDALQNERDAEVVTERIHEALRKPLRHQRPRDLRDREYRRRAVSSGRSHRRRAHGERVDGVATGEGRRPQSNRPSSVRMQKSGCERSGPCATSWATRSRTKSSPCATSCGSSSALAPSAASPRISSGTIRPRAFSKRTASSRQRSGSRSLRWWSSRRSVSSSIKSAPGRVSHKNLPMVSMRVVSSHFLTATFPERLGEMLRARGLGAKSLEIVVSETIMAQLPGRAIENIKKLHDLGVPVGISDFGSSFSPFRFLSFVPISSIDLSARMVNSLSDPCHAAVARDPHARLRARDRRERRGFGGAIAARTVERPAVQGDPG